MVRSRRREARALVARRAVPARGVSGGGCGPSRAVAARTEDLLGLLRPAPAAAERLVARGLARAPFVDSLVLSDLGALPHPPSFGGGAPTGR
jgi:hypothetical protein